MSALEVLPERVAALEVQFSLLRDEMRSEFSAMRGDMHAGDEETRRILREEIRTANEDTQRILREEIRTADVDTQRTLREEIRAGDEETRRLMRVLHEDVISRIALLQEGWRG
jgi:hypothetical protein